MDTTNCYTYFCIESSGDIEDAKGLVANEDGAFEPEYITEKLNIEPYSTHRINEPLKHGIGVSLYSTWEGCLQNEPQIDAEEQLVNIVRILKDKIPELLEIKEKFDVSFSLIVVPHIYNEEQPIMDINKEIIEFCYLTGTEIFFDLYVYDKE